ncbi:MAG TPA: hypothetical protein VM223_12450 [Planctomycetota bacterium]|nr:hypothetical protein [Planctomycetota bacterium]HUW32414.1 hypothetical protein [Planctomycetota bacterium]
MPPCASVQAGKKPAARTVPWNVRRPNFASFTEASSTPASPLVGGK